MRTHNDLLRECEKQEEKIDLNFIAKEFLKVIILVFLWILILSLFA